MPAPEHWPLGLTLLVFVASGATIALVGTRMARLADRLADLTGLGEAVFGAILLGASTSLSGIVVSMTAASAGKAELAVSNAVGGIAVQTVFLVVADLFYRRANLEHAAASLPNLINGAMLCALLAVPLMAATAPPVTLFGVHPASICLLILYGFGLRLASLTRDDPAWHPVRTGETFEDVPGESVADGAGQGRLWMGFAVAVVLVGVAGYLVGLSGMSLVRLTGLSETLVGALFTSVVTSLPELVTAVAAVRQGALTLAVGGIIGGNTFDVLFLALSDAAYRPGSIYHAIGEQPLFIISLTILLTATLLLGLIRRERNGIGNIGFESWLVLMFYGVGFSVIVIG
ncbi:sodium/calcium exchanger membrane region [Thiorhodococcus drewsii AZ1]|uniref:Sodium/calcium exchanger membrane region n=1 Tax=Thiorhodococcus drewsii AZ1 TaxID=765913 RepID=G2E2J2_9GAMM|nr:cation transporter [Thiorhodococcus drewsii]EGV30792.1 sodium/calcium exchanger membrane region [Thiorhodococcus drewsii AZ1]